MSRHEEMCPHCRTKQAGDDESVESVEQEIALPTAPTPIRVYVEGRPFDCTLHPDGTLTAVFNGEQRRNFMTFADMRERAWARAHIEFNPEPLPEDPEPEQAAPVVQEALSL